MHEVWQPVVGYEGLYEVSDQGRVRSLDRKVKNGKGGYKIMKGRMLTCTGAKSQRYLFVTLSKEGKPKHLLVHRLVLEAFVGPCPHGMETLHGHGGPHDNRLANLSWGTRSENSRDKWEQGSMPCGERHHATKLSKDEVRAIRKDTRPASQIAKDYSASIACIYGIKARRNWGWLS